MGNDITSSQSIEKYLFYQGLEVYSVARKRLGYVVRTLIDTTENKKILVVRFRDNREVVLYVFPYCSRDNIYPNTFYINTIKKYGVSQNAVETDMQVAEYNPSHKYERVPGFEYSYKVVKRSAVISEQKNEIEELFDEDQERYGSPRYTTLDELGPLAEYGYEHYE